MSIIIASRHKACELVSETPNHYNVVCITEVDFANGIVPVPQAIQEHAKSHLWLCFSDFLIETELSPQIEHVKKALDWAEGKDNLLVTCRAGISRSSAIAYVIACSRALHPRIATNILEQHHYPNTLIVKYGAKILKDDEITAEVYKWIQNTSTFDE